MRKNFTQLITRVNRMNWQPQVVGLLLLFMMIVSQTAVGQTITSISPTCKTAGDGDFALTINGTGFNGGPSVTFNGTPVSFTVNGNSTVITAQIPAALVATAGNYEVRVTKGNASPSSNLLVAPQTNAGSITSSQANVCIGSQNVIYSVAAINGAQTYMWTVPSGATIVSGLGTRQITVNFGQSASSGVVSLTAINACGTSGSTSILNVTVNQLPAAPNVTADSRCGAGTLQLSASGAPNNGSYRWYTVSSGGTAIAGANEATFTTPSLTSTTSYWVSTVNTAGCESASRTQVIATINAIPSAPTTSSDSRCGAGIVQLSASGTPSGGSYRWYTVASGGSPIANVTGASYSPSLTTTTTYYVATVSSADCESTTRTAVTATINDVPPAPSVNSDSRCGTGSVTLSASGALGGGSYRWYTVSSGGTAISGVTGDTYSPIVSATTPYYVSIVSAAGCEGPRATVIATVNPVPTVQISNPAPVCTPTTVNLQAAAVTAGSTAGLTYTYWSNAAATTPLANPSAVAVSGTYYIKGTTTAGCFDIQPVVVVVNQTPGAPSVVGSAAEICGSGTTQLSVSGAPSGGRYQWYTASGTLIENATANTYTTPTITTTTKYFVSTISAAGCESATRTEVTAVVNPIPEAPTVAAPAPRCGAGPVSMTASAVTNANSARWYNAASGGNPLHTGLTYAPTNVSATTTFYVSSYNTLTNCESQTRTAVTATVITPPVATINTSTPRTFCTGGQVVLTAQITPPSPEQGSYTYQWRKNGTNIPAATGTTFTASESGDYTVVVSTTVGDCVSAPSALVTVTVLSQPIATVNGPNQEQCIGANNRTTFTVTGTYANGTPKWETSNSNFSIQSASYNASTGVATATIQATGTGTATVTLSTTNTTAACNTASEAITLTVNPLPVAAIVPTGPTVFCQGEYVMLEATAAPDGEAYFYEWFVNNGSTVISRNRVYEAIESGSYSVRITTGNGCIATSSAIPVKVDKLTVATVSVTGPTTFCDGGSVKFDAVRAPAGQTAYSYQWFKDDVQVGTNNSTFTAAESGNYYVVVSAEGCDRTSDIIEVTELPQPTANITTQGATICQNTSGPTTFTVTGTYSGGTGTWTVSNGFTYIVNSTTTDPQGVTTSTITVTAPASISSIVSSVVSLSTANSESNCVTQTRSITLRVQPAIAGNSIAGVAEYCQGASASALSSNGTLSGGTGTYTYQWQQSNSLNGTWENAAGTSTGVTYTPLTTSGGTTYYRRLVSSGECNNDDSNVIAVTVTPTIANTISTTTTAYCQGAVAVSIGGAVTGGNGTGSYTYTWQSSTAAGGPWNTIASATSVDYIPATTVAGTTYYKRIVSSGNCANKESNVISITVNPTLVNTISGTSEYCQGATATSIGGAVSGGNGTYSYSWQMKTGVNGSWETVTGSGSSITPATAQAGEFFYKRIVSSGACINDESNEFKVTVTPAITQNAIAGKTAYCKGELGEALGGAVTGGNGPTSYTYTWQSSSTGAANSWTNIPSSNTATYTPQTSIANTTYYRRGVISGNCITYSEALMVTVTETISNNAISTTAPASGICTNTSPSTISGTAPTGGNGSYTFVWQRSTTSAIAGFDDITNTNVKDYNPGNLMTTTWFRRVTRSGNCETVSAAVQVVVNPVIANNYLTTSDLTICTNTSPSVLSGTTPTGGNDTYTFVWQRSTTSATTGFDDITGTNVRDYNPGNLTTTTWFRRKVTSGGCESVTSPAIKVTVTPAITGNAISGTQAVCSGAPVAPLGQASNATLAGGTTSNSFQWEQRIGTDAWTTIGGATNASYTPPIQTVTSTTVISYRRVVSGGGCSNTSNEVNVTFNPLPAKPSITNLRPTVYTADAPIAMQVSPASATGGFFTIKNAAGQTVSSSATFSPCQLKAGMFTITYSYGNGTCSNTSDPVTVEVKQSTYTVVVTSDPFPTCRGQITNYKATVYRDVESVIYPYKTNAAGVPIGDNGAPIGPQDMVVANPNYPFPAGTNPPEILKLNAFRYFQPIVNGGVVMDSTLFIYQWTKNQSTFPGNESDKNATFKNASLSSLDYLAVLVTSKDQSSGACITPITRVISDRKYTSATVNYEVALLSDKTTICKGDEVKFTADLNDAFGFWSSINLRLYWMLDRNGVISQLGETIYTTGDKIEFPTIGPENGFLDGDKVFVEFSSALDMYNNQNKCARGFITSQITIRVNDLVSATGIPKTPVVCAGSTETFSVTPVFTGTAPLNYTWTVGNKTYTTTTPSLPVVAGSDFAPGTYPVSVVVANICESMPVDLGSLTIQAQPTAALALGAGEAAAKCMGANNTTTFTLVGTTNYTPAWSILSGPATVSSDGVVTVTGTGTVRVRLTSSNPTATGCIAATREMDLTVYLQPAAVASVEGNATQCSNTDNPATYTVRGIYTGTAAVWSLPQGSAFEIVNQSASNGVTTATVRATGIGSSTIILSASNPATGCTEASSAVVLVANPLPLARTMNSPTYCSVATPEGAEIVLNNPEDGVRYELRNKEGQLLGTFSGTGNTLNLGARPAGDYTIAGVNTANNASCYNESVATVTVTDTRGIDAAGDFESIWLAYRKWEVTALTEELPFGVTIPAGSTYTWYVKEPGDAEFREYGSATTNTMIIENVDPLSEIYAEVKLTNGDCRLVQFVTDRIVPLPVELLYFNATKRGNDVVLDWATASELDNKGFEVQVSSDAKNFRALGFVESKVNTTSLKQLYTFVDKENGKQGVRYYRLKQVDLDGKFEIFNIKAIHFDEISMTKVKAYPNPFHSEVELSIDAELDGELLITVTTATGQQLLQRSVQVAKGTNIEKLTLDPNLPRGVYIISTRMGDFNNHFKLLKQ